MSQSSKDDAKFAAELPWTEVLQFIERGATALLPVGSTEAHGPHLPLNVDVVISVEVCRRAALRLAAQGRPCLIFPPVAYALTEFASSFAGTVSVSASSALPYLTDVLAGIASHGFQRIGVVNHHLEPAHFQLVHEAARAAAARTGVAIAVPDHRKKPIAPLLGEEFTQGGSHAGSYETSLMLAAAASLVDDRVRAALPNHPVNLPAAIKAGARTFKDCGGEQAYFGSPASATATEGARLLEILAEATEAALLALQPP
jgi:creatinine amidohydrolase